MTNSVSLSLSFVTTKFIPFRISSPISIEPKKHLQILSIIDNIDH